MADDKKAFSEESMKEYVLRVYGEQFLYATDVLEFMKQLYVEVGKSFRVVHEHDGKKTVIEMTISEEARCLFVTKATELSMSPLVYEKANRDRADAEKKAPECCGHKTSILTTRDGRLVYKCEVCQKFYPYQNGKETKQEGEKKGETKPKEAPTNAEKPSKPATDTGASTKTPSDDAIRAAEEVQRVLREDFVDPPVVAIREGMNEIFYKCPVCGDECYDNRGENRQRTMKNQKPFPYFKCHRNTRKDNPDCAYAVYPKRR